MDYQCRARGIVRLYEDDLIINSVWCGILNYILLSPILKSKIKTKKVICGISVTISRWSKNGTRLNYIIVATTRPETMLGDTGVAVNPEDARYKDLIGKEILLPIVNRHSNVSDEHADMEGQVALRSLCS